MPVGADAGGDPGVVGHDAVAGEQRGAGRAQHQLAAPQVARRREAPPVSEVKANGTGSQHRKPRGAKVAGDLGRFYPPASGKSSMTRERPRQGEVVASVEGKGGGGESETPSSAAHRRSASICGGRFDPPLGCVNLLAEENPDSLCVLENRHFKNARCLVVRLSCFSTKNPKTSEYKQGRGFRTLAISTGAHLHGRF
jgi:hypothetical protein